MAQITGKKPKIGQTKEAERDKYITSCTFCRAGIFKDHEYHWSKGNGIVHIDCNDPRLEN